MKVQLLSKHPDAEKPDCYILGDMYSIFSRNILQVLPNAALWISGLYRQTENEAILQELTVQVFIHVVLCGTYSSNETKLYAGASSVLHSPQV